MRLAMDEARQAEAMGEVPVGAVIVSRDGEILARAGNASITKDDPTAHAEMIALREACRNIGNYRLDEAVLVATLEPCLMCLGAMVHARVGLLVYGASDPKSGVAKSRMEGFALPFLNHRVEAHGGVLGVECGEMLTEFFRSRRKKPSGAD